MKYTPIDVRTTEEVYDLEVDFGGHVGGIDTIKYERTSTRDEKIRLSYSTCPFLMMVQIGLTYIFWYWIFTYKCSFQMFDISNNLEANNSNEHPVCKDPLWITAFLLWLHKHYYSLHLLSDYFI